MVAMRHNNSAELGEKHRGDVRVAGVDAARGLAIILMTVFHQHLLFSLKKTDPFVFLGVSAVGGLAAPLFLAVAGISAFFFMRRHERPVEMILHGAVIFAVGWIMHFVVHKNFVVDFNAIEIIGGCYFLLGMAWALSRLLWWWLPVILTAGWTIWIFWQGAHLCFRRWPYPVFFVCGYCLALLFFQYWHKPVLRRTIFCLIVVGWTTLTVLGVVNGIFPDRITSVGLLYHFTWIFLIMAGLLWFERTGLTDNIFWRFLIRYGQFSLTLYYVQQFFLRICQKFKWNLHIFQGDGMNWLIQSLVLLLTMYLLTKVFQRVCFFRLEWIVKQVELIILARGRRLSTLGVKWKPASKKI